MVGLDELNKPGFYIISYWNDGKPFTKGGVHTVAIIYNGIRYKAYNKSGNDEADPKTYVKDGYICGYYLG